MFVTTLEMDNFDRTKMNARFQKFTACLQEGLIHEWKQSLVGDRGPVLRVLGCMGFNWNAQYTVVITVQ